MFGYIMADRSSLSEEEVCRYGGCYCGLCRTLGKRHGLLGRMTLNYDMTFLVLVLGSLYEPQEESGLGRCPVHPLKKRPYWSTKYTDYAADLNLLLTYESCMDDWQDERNFPRFLLAKALQRRVRAIKKAYPRQAGAVAENLALLHRYESGPEVSADRASDAFGDLMGELFVIKEDDYWAGDLRTLGKSLGRFIYILDACLDLEDDRKKGTPNPLLALNPGERTKAGDYDLLTMLLGDASRSFEHLPLEQDLHLLRNILYSGLWQRYNDDYARRHKETKEKENIQ